MDERRGDTAFFAQSRESFHANVVATQNRAGLLMNAPKEEAIDSLLGNCAVKMRTPSNGEPSYDPDERFPWEKERDEEAPTDTPSSTVDEHTKLELAAEVKAQRGHTLIYGATTTGTRLHQRSIDKLSEQGSSYTHIDTPEVTPSAKAQRRDAWKDQKPSEAAAEQEQDAPDQSKEHGYER